MIPSIERIFLLSQFSWVWQWTAVGETDSLVDSLQMSQLKWLKIIANLETLLLYLASIQTP